MKIIKKEIIWKNIKLCFWSTIYVDLYKVLVVDAWDRKEGL